MEIKVRCQSCGMPLGAPGFYGMNLDGTENIEYCKFCYTNGEYTNPDQTMDEMIESSIKFMTENLKMDAEESKKMSHNIIPSLRRWRK